MRLRSYILVHPKRSGSGKGLPCGQAPHIGVKAPPLKKTGSIAARQASSTTNIRAQASGWQHPHPPHLPKKDDYTKLTKTKNDVSPIPRADVARPTASRKPTSRVAPSTAVVCRPRPHVITARIRSPRDSLSLLPVAGTGRDARSCCDEENGASFPSRLSAWEEPPRSPADLFETGWSKTASSSR